MFILVDSNKVIVGTSMLPVAESYLKENNFSIFQMNQNEFSDKMLGSVLSNFEVVK
jgi:hypothetical protein